MGGNVPHEVALDLQQLLGSDLVRLVQENSHLQIRINFFQWPRPIS